MGSYTAKIISNSCSKGRVTMRRDLDANPASPRMVRHKISRILNVNAVTLLGRFMVTTTYLSLS